MSSKNTALSTVSNMPTNYAQLSNWCTSENVILTMSLMSVFGVVKNIFAFEDTNPEAARNRALFYTACATGGVILSQQKPNHWTAMIFAAFVGAPIVYNPYSRDIPKNPERPKSFRLGLEKLGGEGLFKLHGNSLRSEFLPSDFSRNLLYLLTYANEDQIVKLLSNSSSSNEISFSPTIQQSLAEMLEQAIFDDFPSSLRINLQHPLYKDLLPEKLYDELLSLQEKAKNCVPIDRQNSCVKEICKDLFVLFRARECIFFGGGQYNSLHRDHLMREQVTSTEQNHSNNEGAPPASSKPAQAPRSKKKKGPSQGNKHVEAETHAHSASLNSALVPCPSNNKGNKHVEVETNAPSASLNSALGVPYSFNNKGGCSEKPEEIDADSD
ncbi:MAG TPA: hypothetical protein VLE96_06630 [Chlamydiales bacterium]|nr:hypothetical protein [Chlamydiales bacterium]